MESIDRLPSKLRANSGDGDGDFAEISHYSIELATTAPVGTYYPWKELWCGAGHESPNFTMLVAEQNARKQGDTVTLRRLELAKLAKQREDEEEASHIEEARFDDRNHCCDAPASPVANNMRCLRADLFTW